jgi:hypothetical protein
MSWIDTLDRLITDSWKASRDESVAMLDGLLALPLHERWDLFVTRDARLAFLSDEDYVILFSSLNAHAMMAHAGDSAGTLPVTEEATEVLPETHYLGDEAYTPQDQQMVYEEQPDPAAASVGRSGWRAWWRSRMGLRWLSVGIVAATALVLVGAFLAVIVLYLLPGSPRVSLAEVPLALLSKLDDVAQDQAQLAKHLIQIDNRVVDLAATVETRFGTTMRAVRLNSSLEKLQAAIERGQPFTAELAPVAAGLSGDEALTPLVRRLEASAASGVPSLLLLRERFDDLAPRLGGVIDNRDLLAPHLIEAAPPPGLFNRMVGWIGSGFGLIESAETKRFRATLGGIRAALGLGNLPVAVRQIEDLHAYPADLVAAWLATARVRLDAEATLAAMRQGLMLNQAAAAPQTP